MKILQNLIQFSTPKNAVGIGFLQKSHAYGIFRGVKLVLKLEPAFFKKPQIRTGLVSVFTFARQFLTFFLN